MSDLVIPKRFDGTQYRTAEVEVLDVDNGAIAMRAVPYDTETQLADDLFESFTPGAFARATKAPHRAKLFHDHGGPLIGQATSIEDRSDGVYLEARFASTSAAQEARTLASEGILDSASIEFRTMPAHVKVDRRDDGLHVRHDRAHLLGVALVAYPAYQDAAVLSARDERVEKEREAILAKLRSLTS